MVTVTGLGVDPRYGIFPKQNVSHDSAMLTGLEDPQTAEDTARSPEGRYVASCWVRDAFVSSRMKLLVKFNKLHIHMIICIYIC